MSRSRSTVRKAAWPLLLAALLAPASSLAQEAASGQQESVRTLELSLREAVELTLKYNLQVQVNALNPDIREEGIRSARATFDPVFTFNLPRTFNRSTQPSSSQLGGADVLTQEFIASGFSFREQTGWGLQWNLSGEAQRFVTNNEFSTFNPRWDTNVSLNVTQPLLRDLGETVNKQQLLVARNDYSVSLQQFRAQLQQTLFQVIGAYWQLVFDMRNLDIQRRSLELAREQLDRNETMVRIGVLAAADVIQARQQVADAELNVIQAENTLANQQDNLKALLNVDAFTEEGWDLQIVPTDEPLTSAEPIDIDAAIEEALRRNPNIIQDRINLDSREIDLRAASNQLLPRIDFIGSVTLNGLGGDQIFRSGALGGDIIEIQEGGLTESFDQLLSGDFRNWSLGLQVSFPLRNDFARAQHAQASIRERQAQAQIANRELQIRLNVRNATRTVENGIEQVRAAQNSVEFAEQQYEAEVRRFENGLGNTFQLISFQRQLALSQARELGALINLNVGLASFELAKGTLLESYGVTIQDAATGPVPAAARR